MEYDSKGDRLIQKNPEANNQTWPIAMWFTSDNLCEAVWSGIFLILQKSRQRENGTSNPLILLVLSVLVDGKFLEASVLKRKFN